MKTFPIGLVIFGVLLIVWPALIVTIIGGFIIFVGASILLVMYKAKKFKGKKPDKEEYVKFGNYKIYK